MKNKGIGIETFESIKELEYPQDHDSDQTIDFTLGELNEGDINDPRVRAKFNRFNYNDISVSAISQDFYKSALLQLKEKSIIYSNQTNKEMFIISIKRSQVWICHSMTSNHEHLVVGMKDINLAPFI